MVTMALRLAAGEPDAGPWRAERLATLAAELVEAVARADDTRADGARADDTQPDWASRADKAIRPAVIAIDGRSSSGKTTLAQHLSALVADSAVVHTDDVAFGHSRFGWADLLAEYALRPARRGRPVRYRPPGWAAAGRDGAIEVPAPCRLLVVEGVGAGRGALASLCDVVIWVQSDERETAARSRARIGTPGGPASADDLAAWMAEEEPFVDGQRTWERAGLIVCGTPPAGFDAAGSILVSDGPGISYRGDFASSQDEKSPR